MAQNFPFSFPLSKFLAKIFLRPKMNLQAQKLFAKFLVRDLIFNLNSALTKFCSAKDFGQLNLLKNKFYDLLRQDTLCKNSPRPNIFFKNYPNARKFPKNT